MCKWGNQICKMLTENQIFWYPRICFLLPHPLWNCPLKHIETCTVQWYVEVRYSLKHKMYTFQGIGPNYRSHFYLINNMNHHLNNLGKRLSFYQLLVIIQWLAVRESILSVFPISPLSGHAHISSDDHICCVYTAINIRTRDRYTTCEFRENKSLMQVISSVIVIPMWYFTLANYSWTRHSQSK
jgi:hypothetical protein